VTDPQGYDTTVAVYNLDSSKKVDPGLFRSTSPIIDTAGLALIFSREHLPHPDNAPFFARVRRMAAS